MPATVNGTPSPPGCASVMVSPTASPSRLAIGSGSSTAPPSRSALKASRRWPATKISERVSWKSLGPMPAIPTSR